MATPAHSPQAQPQQAPPKGGQPKQAHSNHGNTVAAWVAVGILIVAALIMCIAVAFTNKWTFLVGMVIAAIGLVIGKLLADAGHGMPRPDDNRATRGVR